MPDSTRTTDEMECPQCGGRMWDNRETKRNPKMPDYKCRDRSCTGVIWPPRNAKPKPAPYVQRDTGSLPNDDDSEAYSDALTGKGYPPEQTPNGNKSTQLYLAAMKFVVNTVVPVWEAGKIDYTAADVNAATATIMIDHQRRSGR